MFWIEKSVASRSEVSRQGGRAWIVILAFALAACTGQPTASPVNLETLSPSPTAANPTAPSKPDDVNLRLDFTINGKHAPFLVGIAQGFYSDAGINLSVEEGRGSLAAAQLVASKNDLVALADASAMATAVAGGAPIKMVACFIQKSPTAAFSFGTLDSPADLVGKIIGVSANTQIPVALDAFMSRHEIEPSQVTVVQMDGPALGPALIEGRIDVLVGLLITEGAALPILSGKPVNHLLFADWEQNSLAHGLVFHNDTIEQNPDLVRRFVEASVRSWQYAVDHPDEAVDALMVAFPEANPEIVANQLEFSLGLLHTDDSADQPLGWMAGKNWQETVDLLTKYAGVENTVPTPDFYTNDFVD